MESITKTKGIISTTFIVYIFVAVLFVALSQIMLKWVTEAFTIEVNGANLLQ